MGNNIRVHSRGEKSPSSFLEWIRRKEKINVIKNNYKLKMYIVEGSQEDALWQKNMINSTSTVGMTGKQSINKLRNMFPEVKEKTN